MAKSYSTELKSSAVYEICELRLPRSEVSARYDVPIKTLENWVTAYNKDKKVFDVTQISEADRLRRLEKENSQLRRENEILKKQCF